MNGWLGLQCNSYVPSRVLRIAFISSSYTSYDWVVSPVGLHTVQSVVVPGTWFYTFTTSIRVMMYHIHRGRRRMITSHTSPEDQHAGEAFLVDEWRKVPECIRQYLLWSDVIIGVIWSKLWIYGRSLMCFGFWISSGGFSHITRVWFGTIKSDEIQKSKCEWVGTDLFLFFERWWQLAIITFVGGKNFFCGNISWETISNCGTFDWSSLWVDHRC